jgi:hypothetical protein
MILRQTIPAFKCAACRRSFARASDCVFVSPTWHAEKDVLCPTCWNTIMEAAQKHLLFQPELF